MALQQNIRILHTQHLIDGQKELVEKYHWNICSLYDIDLSSVFQDIQFLFVDEAQLLSQIQLETLLSLSHQKEIPVLFSYDPKEEQYRLPSFDLMKLIQDQYPETKLKPYKLTNKIRTNKEMADFIDDLMKLTANHSDESFQNIRVEYIATQDILQNYCKVLTKASFNILDINHLALEDLTEQEYKKAALILDQNCYYQNGELHMKNHKEQVLYEVITRVVEELKIVVVQNPDLYRILLAIKK